MQDVLLEHDVERRVLVEILYSQHLAEDAVYVAFGVEYRHVLAPHNDEAITLCLAVLYARQHVFSDDGLGADQLVADIVQRTVGGDVAVDEVLDGSEVGNDNRRAACGDIDS